jgi:hypothetical protein
MHPVDITIATRTFHIAGSISTQTTINDKDATIGTDIDLTGHFLNFAPKASTVESTKHVECAYGRDYIAGNKSPILLDGAGSFEVYNDPPNSTTCMRTLAWSPRRCWAAGRARPP